MMVSRVRSVCVAPSAEMPSGMVIVVGQALADCLIRRSQPSPLVPRGGLRTMLAGTKERLTMTDQHKDPQQAPLTLREMLQSVLAAALGVRSGKNRSRDFSR